MEVSNFKNIKELLDFIIIKCGDMDYNYHPDESLLEIITSNVNIEYVYYAILNVSQTKFVPIRSLSLQSLNLDFIDDGYLEKMDSLDKLWLGLNNLREIPKLPNNLSFLFVSNNQLTGLPELPENLQKLYCTSNKIEELPNLKNVEYLDCRYNQLEEIPFSKKLKTVKWEYNPGNNPEDFDDEE